MEGGGRERGRKRKVSDSLSSSATNRCLQIRTTIEGLLTSAQRRHAEAAPHRHTRPRTHTLDRAFTCTEGL